MLCHNMRTLSYNQRKGAMSEYNYTVLFEPAEEGGYVVTCPALPGLVTEGDTYEEAHDRVIEAIEGYLESLQKDGLPIPEDDAEFQRISKLFPETRFRSVKPYQNTPP